MSTPDNRLFSRRLFAPVVLGGLTAACDQQPTPTPWVPDRKPLVFPTPTPLPTFVPLPETSKPVIVTPTPELVLPESLPAKIVSLKPGSPERNQLETRLASQILAKPADMSGLSSIRTGFLVITQETLRRALLDEQYLRRNRGDFKEHYPRLDPAKEAWAIQQGMHPETLAIAESASRRIEDILENLRVQAGITDSNDSFVAANYLMNPGGAAAAVMYRTENVNPSNGVSYGFSQVGLSLKDSAGPSLDPMLSEIAQHLSQETSLPFKPETLPGRTRGDPSSPIHMIGLLTPEQILTVYKDFGSNHPYNPYDLFHSVEGLLYTLAKVEYAPNGAPRGYRRGSVVGPGHDYFARSRSAIADRLQIPYDHASTIIYARAEDYFEKFIAPTFA